MESPCVNRCRKHIKTGLYKKRNIFVVFCNKKASETLPFSIPIYYVDIFKKYIPWRPCRRQGLRLLLSLGITVFSLARFLRRQSSVISVSATPSSWKKTHAYLSKTKLKQFMNINPLIFKIYIFQKTLKRHRKLMSFRCLLRFNFSQFFAAKRSLLCKNIIFQMVLFLCKKIIDMRMTKNEKNLI